MSEKKIPLIAAHRGSAGGNIPCNSESAFRAALMQGADIIELDVSVSRDKKLFVFHPGKEYCYLSSKRSLSSLTAKQVGKRCMINCDRTNTIEKILTLDDALELLKDKCRINIDKFWSAPDLISERIRAHNMVEQVIIKTSDSKRQIDAAEEVASDIPLMVITRTEDKVTPTMDDRKLRFIGIEALFDSDEMPIASQDYIDAMHKKGLIVWGNAIVYNYKDILSDRHTDDTAMRGDPETGWGWFMDRGFDIVQTDWISPMKQFYREKSMR